MYKRQAKLSAQLEAAPEAVTQYYSFFSDLQANVEKDVYKRQGMGMWICASRRRSRST